MLGKAVVDVTDCRPGVPHIYFKHLVEGKLELRLLFDFDELPSTEADTVQYSYKVAAKA